MFTQPDDVDEKVLADALGEGWGHVAHSLEYLAVGFGSHHWLATDARGGRWFVTVDDLLAKVTSDTDTVDAAFDRLDAAYTTARALRVEAELPFVVAPLRGRDGSLLRRLGERYTFAVLPHLDVVGVPAWGGFASPSARDAALDMVRAVHRATPVAAPHARTEDFELPNRAQLERALSERDGSWDAGPYAERARILLDEHATGVERLLLEYDRLVDASRDPARFVVTHGEPHSANAFETATGWVLVDWDTALMAPPERDLWHLGTGGGEPAQLDLYRLSWDLTEIGGLLGDFRRPHTETADDTVRWRGLQEYLDPRERWPGLF